MNVYDYVYVFAAGFCVGNRNGYDGFQQIFEQ